MHWKTVTKKKEDRITVNNHAKGRAKYFYIDHKVRKGLGWYRKERIREIKSLFLHEAYNSMKI